MNKKVLHQLILTPVVSVNPLLCEVTGCVIWGKLWADRTNSELPRGIIRIKTTWPGGDRLQKEFS